MIDLYGLILTKDKRALSCRALNGYQVFMLGQLCLCIVINIISFTANLSFSGNLDSTWGGR